MGDLKSFVRMLSLQTAEVVSPKPNYKGHFLPSFVVKQTIFVKLLYVLIGRIQWLRFFSKFNVIYRTPSLKRGFLKVLKRVYKETYLIGENREKIKTERFI